MRKDFTSLALLLSGLLPLGGRSLGGLQSLFSFSPRISQGCNASRQSSDFLSGRCQLMRKDFTSLALLLSGLLLLGGRSLRSFRRSVRRICSRIASFDLLARGCELTDKVIASLALLLSGPLLLGGRSLRSFRRSVRCICSRLASFDLFARGCELADKAIASLALLLSGLLLLGGRSLGSLQGVFGFSQGCDASRQSSDILSGRCQLAGKDFTSLTLLLSGLLLLGCRSLGSLQGVFGFSQGCDASRQSSDILSGRCQLAGKDFTLLALLLSGPFLLDGRSLGSLQGIFSFSPRISQGCDASRQSSDFLSGRCQLAGKDFTSLALLLSGLLLLGGRSLGSLQSAVSFSPRIS